MKEFDDYQSQKDRFNSSASDLKIAADNLKKAIDAEVDDVKTVAPSTT